MEGRSVALRIGIIAAVAAFAIVAVLIRAKQPLQEVSNRPTSSPKPQVIPKSHRTADSSGNAVAGEQLPETSQDRPSDGRSRTSKTTTQVDADLQGKALHDATLRTLIQNAKVAQQRGDLQTRDAMLQGLKKEPDRAKALLQDEISATRDLAVAYALQTLLTELQ